MSGVAHPLAPRSGTGALRLAEAVHRFKHRPDHGW
jgi:hypothetical protein